MNYLKGEIVILDTLKPDQHLICKRQYLNQFFRIMHLYCVSTVTLLHIIFHAMPCHAMPFIKEFYNHLGPVTDAKGRIEDSAFGAFKAVLLELTSAPQVGAAEKL